MFPGCLVLQRMPQYEKAAKRVLRELDIYLEDIRRAACCGAPVEPFTEDWVFLAAYNLGLADKMGLEILTLCGNCTNTLLRARAALGDDTLRARVNDRLDKMGLHIEGEVGVKHLVQVLTQHLECLRRKIRTRLSLKVALTHPCQVFRPHEIVRFDDPVRPQAMRRIVELTGAEIVAYEGEYDCCGSTLYLADEELALEAGGRKLGSAGAADVLVDACGNCQLLLERFQNMIRWASPGPKMPVLTLPQLLGLAMDVGATELGIGPVMFGRLLEGSA